MLHPSSSSPFLPEPVRRPKADLESLLPEEQVLAALRDERGQEGTGRRKCLVCCGLRAGAYTLAVTSLFYFPVAFLHHWSSDRAASRTFSSFASSGLSSPAAGSPSIPVSRLRGAATDAPKKLGKARGFGRDAAVAATTVSAQNPQFLNAKQQQRGAGAAAATAHNNGGAGHNKIPSFQSLKNGMIRPLGRWANRLLLFPLPFAVLGITHHALLSEGLWVGSYNTNTPVSTSNSTNSSPSNSHARRRTAIEAQLTATVSNFLLSVGLIGVGHLVSRRYLARISTEYQRSVTEQWWARCRATSEFHQHEGVSASATASKAAGTSSSSATASRGLPFTPGGAGITPETAPKDLSAYNTLWNSYGKYEFAWPWFSARRPYFFGGITHTFDTIQAVWSTVIYHTFTYLMFYAVSMKTTRAEKDISSPSSSATTLPIRSIFTATFFGMRMSLPPLVGRVQSSSTTLTSSSSDASHHHASVSSEAADNNAALLSSSSTDDDKHNKPSSQSHNSIMATLATGYVNVCNPRWRQWADYEYSRVSGLEDAEVTGDWLIRAEKSKRSVLGVDLSSTGSMFRGDEDGRASQDFYPKKAS